MKLFGQAISVDLQDSSNLGFMGQLVIFPLLHI